MSPKIFLKRLAPVPLFVFLLLALSGCPFMMPFMMGPMLGKSIKKPVDPVIEATLAELIEEGVKSLADNRSTYEYILVGQTISKGDLVPPKHFERSLVEKLRSRSEWQIVEQPQGSTSNEKPPESPGVDARNSLGVLNAQLYRARGRLYLSLQLVDAGSNQLFWSSLFSKVVPESERDSEHQDTQLTVGS
jgi:hypothetical protein